MRTVRCFLLGAPILGLLGCIGSDVVEPIPDSAPVVAQKEEAPKRSDTTGGGGSGTSSSTNEGTAPMVDPAPNGGGGDGGSPAGEPCGGERGTTCSPGLFCKLKVEQACGVTSKEGSCELIPFACTKELVPVCGCDGNTYDNECLAYAAGKSVQGSGACPPKQGGETGGACGGFVGATCKPGWFCSNSCGRLGGGNTGGTCIQKPEICSAVYQPVCGCDGQTYSNACTANASGVAVASNLPCTKG